MSKLAFVAVAFSLALCAGNAPARAMILGPHPHGCEGGRPAMLVKISGLKSRTGSIRVQAYGGDPQRFFDRNAYIDRIDVATPAAGAVDVCVPVAKPGVYAISVRHDVDGDGKAGRADGGGMSGNPDVSLFDIMFKKKPSPSRVSVSVGQTVTDVPIVMNYVQGGSFRPIASASR